VRLLNRFKSAHTPLSNSGRLMRPPLDYLHSARYRELYLGSVLDAQQHSFLICLSLFFSAHHDVPSIIFYRIVWLRGHLVPLNKYINDFTILINGSP
jgi:hypothetical protein